jgi:hypothetical protein
MFLGSTNSMTLSGKIDVETGSPSFKMAAANPDVCVSHLLYKIVKKFQRLPACFRVGKLNDAIVQDRCRNRKSEIQDSGCPTRWTYISASMQDSKEIPTAKYMFSMMPESMEHTAVYCNYVLHCTMPNFKMVGNQAGSTYILLCTTDRNNIPKRTFNQLGKNNLLYIAILYLFINR